MNRRKSRNDNWIWFAAVVALALLTRPRGMQVAILE